MPKQNKKGFMFADTAIKLNHHKITNEKMKFKILMIIILSLVSNKIISQNEHVNPQGKWFFGAELGLNTITSIHPNHTKSIQCGILSEYYFAKQWSVSGRVKYFKIGVSNDYHSANGVFDGAVISVPLDIKWEYRIANNFKGNLQLGVAFNKEIKSNYDYPTNESTNFSTFYASFNPGIGLNYFLFKKHGNLSEL